MSGQITRSVLMVRPGRFGFNPQTAGSNVFQSQEDDGRSSGVRDAAVAEFDALVARLRSEGVNVEVEPDGDDVCCPDAVFPNNWISTHDDGTVVLYPMAAENRRLERRADLVERLVARHGYDTVIDLTRHERRGACLEGTGSLVLDRAHRVAYVCISARSSPDVVRRWARLLGYDTIVSFRASTRTPDGAEVPVYHTNVVMAVGTATALVCAEAVPDPDERAVLLGTLRRTGHTIVDIGLRQMFEFAGNALQLGDSRGERLWVMSDRAYGALSESQRSALAEDARLVHSPVPTIERIGGGSVRCMLAEVFEPR